MYNSINTMLDILIAELHSYITLNIFIIIKGIATP